MKIVRIVCDLCGEESTDPLPYRLFLRERDTIDSIFEAEVCLSCYDGVVSMAEAVVKAHAHNSVKPISTGLQPALSRRRRRATKE